MFTIKKKSKVLIWGAVGSLTLFALPTLLLAKCPPEHIKDALKRFRGVELESQWNPYAKRTKAIRLKARERVSVGGSACPVTFDFVTVSCVGPGGDEVNRKRINLKNYCSGGMCTIQVVEIDCQAALDGVYELIIVPEGSHGPGPVAIGYR